MKKFVFAILFFIISLSAQGEIITGEIEYNAELSGERTFTTQTQKIGFDKIRNFLYDSDNIENLNYLFQGITELKDRKLAKFSDGSYGVQYYNDPMYSWYYSASGKLISFIQKDSFNYPCRIIKFNPAGNIVNTGLRVSDTESFIYSPNGKLLAHWVGNKCYDGNNNIIMTRKIIN